MASVVGLSNGEVARRWDDAISCHVSGESPKFAETTADFQRAIFTFARALVRDTAKQITGSTGENRPSDDLLPTALAESLGKQAETITAQGDMIVQLARKVAERAA